MRVNRCFIRGGFLTYLLLVWLVAAISGCNRPEPAEEYDQVTLQLKWTHQAQFAGFYMAQEEGYYEEENLKVTLLAGGPDIDQAETLRKGGAHFGVVPAESLLLNNAKENRLIAISVIYQRNPTMFVSKKSAGISTPFDIVGRSVAIGDLQHGGFIEGYIQLHALFKKLGLDFSSIRIHPYDSKYEDFIADRVDVSPAYLVGGVMKLHRKGVALNMVWPGDYGIDFYSDTLAATSEFIEHNKELVTRFLRASLKGWLACIKDQDRAVDVTMKYVPDGDRTLQSQMMMNQIPLVNTGDAPIGWMSADVWQKMYSAFEEHGLVRQPIEDISAMHSMYFLKEIYDRGAQ